MFFYTTLLLFFFLHEYRGQHRSWKMNKAGTKQDVITWKTPMNDQFMSLKQIIMTIMIIITLINTYMHSFSNSG